MRRLFSPLALAVLLVLVATVIDPFWVLVRESFEGNGVARYQSLWTEAVHRGALRNSVVLALLTTLGSALLGIPLAVLTHDSGRSGRILRALSLAPLFMPPILGTICFYFLFGRGNVLAQLIPGFDFEFRGFGAVLLVHVLSMCVYFVLFVGAGLERLDPAMSEAARSLGAAPGRVFLRVTLPLLRPALFGASAITFMSSMASFTAPYVFGGGDSYLTTAIYLARQDDPALAAALAIELTVISIAAVMLAPRGARPVVAAGAKPPRKADAVRGRGIRLALASVLVAMVILPLLTVVLLSLKPTGRIGESRLFTDLSLTHYAAIKEAAFDARAVGPSADLLRSIGRSALYATVATLANIAVALALVLGTKKPLRVGLEATAMLPLAIPGTVIGLAVVTAFAARGPLGIGPPLIGTAVLLPLAYFIRNLPILVRAVAAGQEQLSASLPEAARTLGAGPFRTLLRVTIPLLLPAILGGATLAFVGAMGEFVASIFIYTPFTKPAAIAIFDEFSSGRFGAAAASGVLFALATGLLLLLARLALRRR